MIEIKKGNIFTTSCQTIVNTVNCVGVMGAGIAYEFMLRYPQMFEQYQFFCRNRQIDIGNLWVYHQDNARNDIQKILNFPTKRHWKDPSKVEYLEAGLHKFVRTYEQKGITSIAFPLLGASRGGISEKVALATMQRYLQPCNISIEIWYFDPQAKDDLYENFKAQFTAMDEGTIRVKTGLRAAMIKKVKLALEQSNINSLSGLAQAPGIGKGTLEKAFLFINDSDNDTANADITSQRTMDLFDD
jgi:O-acetyl-ADP-ribose deacetylase (regulator of RNase III)